MKIIIMTSLLLQIKVEVKETKEQCEGLKSDLHSVSADLETTLTKKEEEPQILSPVKEQAAAADNENIDGGASLSPPGEGKAVDGKRDGETVPRVPPAVGGGGGGLRKSQSSSAMLNGISLASHSGGGKAANGEQDEGVGGGGLHRSQSSNAILNTSPPAAVGTPQGNGKKTPSPESRRTYAMVVAGIKPASSPPHKISQLQPLLPSSSSCPAPMVSKPYNMYVNL